MDRFTDHSGTDFRLTEERRTHIIRRPEMIDQDDRIAETLADPDEVRTSIRDPAVSLYYRHYDETPVTEKYLLVVAKHADDPFIITRIAGESLRL